MSSFMSSLASLSSRVSTETGNTRTRQLCHSDPTTVGGRLRLCLLLFCIPTWPAILSTAVTTFKLVPIVEHFITIQEVLRDSYPEKLGDLIAALQDERNAIFVFPIRNDTGSIRGVLDNVFERTDQALEEIDRWPIVIDKDKFNRDELGAYLNTTRLTVTGKSGVVNRTQLRACYSNIISSLIESLPPISNKDISNTYINLHYGANEFLYESVILSTNVFPGIGIFTRWQCK